MFPTRHGGVGSIGAYRLLQGVRSQGDDFDSRNDFLEHSVKAYGEWPKEMITEGGSWYRVAFSVWQVEGLIAWRVVRGGERSAIEGFFGEFLKRWIKDFDRYFPTKEGLGSLRRWLQSFAWFHNLIIGCF